MRSEDKFMRRQIDALAEEWAKKKNARYSKSDGWVAEYDERFRAHATTEIGGTFEWEGHQWRLVAIAPAPCECPVNLALVKKRSSKLTTWSAVSCPLNKCEGTWTIESTGPKSSLFAHSMSNVAWSRMLGASQRPVS